MSVFEKLKKYLKNYRPKFFDLIIIGIVLLIVASLYVILFRTKKDLVVIAKVKVDAGSPYWNNDILTTGMKETDSLGLDTAEIVNVRKYDSRPDNPVYYLTLKLKTVYSPGSKTYSYNGKKLTVGTNIKLSINQISFDATISNMGGKEDRYSKQKIKVKARIMNPAIANFYETFGVLPYLADGINIGDEVKDNSGNTILKITGKTVENADKYVINSNGSQQTLKDPFRKDVYLTMDISAYKIGNRYYFFDYIPILVGDNIPVHLSNLSIYPLIISIEEAK